MAVAVAIISSAATDPSGGVDHTRTRVVVEGTLTLTGNYGTATSHGDIVNFNNLSQVKTGSLPTWVEIQENQASASPGTANPPLGFKYSYVQGTNLSNGLLQITGGAVAGAGGGEIAQGGAYSATTPSLNNAVLRYKAWFPHGV